MKLSRDANVVNMLFGSHLYGLNTPSSDLDYKGVYLPTKRELLLGNYPKTYNQSTGGQHKKNTNEDVDTEVIALPYFIKQACQGETFAIDMLHCTNPIHTSENGDIWRELVKSRRMFYSKDMRSYIGYFIKQASKYGVKGSRLACIKNAINTLKLYDGQELVLEDIVGELYLGEYASLTMFAGKGAGATEQKFYDVNGKKYQTTNRVCYVLEQLTNMYNLYGERAKQAETNDGVDWKALSHALRAGYQAKAIYKHGDFEYPLKETDFILSVKQGKLDYTTEVAIELESLVDEVVKLSELSNLPNKVDTSYWDNWLLSIYGEYCE